MPHAFSGETAGRRVRQVVTGDTPAAGAEATITVPAGHLYLIESAFATLTTDATAATRTPALEYGDGHGVFLRTSAGRGQTASLAYQYAFFPEGGGLSSGIYGIAPIPNMTLMPGWTLTTATDGIVAGDQWTALTLMVVDTLILDGAIDLNELPELIVQVAGSPIV